MVKLIFKNVGQGDSIVLKWKIDEHEHIGIIDCALHEGNNPVLNEIKSSGIKSIDFIILSHLHADHFSGMAELLQYCVSNDIIINKFYHTFEVQYFKILSAILVTQANRKMGEKFLATFIDASNKDILLEIDRITHNTTPLSLDKISELVFLAPTGKNYLDFANGQAKYATKQTKSLPDLNNLSSVVKITDGTNAAILTADTTVRQLKRLKGKIGEEIICAQVPHHGSIHNHYVDFWDVLKIKKDCPAIFSVGDVTRDQLPDVEVIQYFDQKYIIESTNFVYGIKEHFGSTIKIAKAKSVSSMLNSFSTLKRSHNPITNSGRFSGDITHKIN